jgi:hypothetical protein
VSYSNTVVVNVPVPQKQPDAVTISTTVKPMAAGVKVEWSVSGADTFDGFIVERVVEKAPEGSPTPAGDTSFTRLQTSDVFCSQMDNSVLPGHTYSYRVGLVVDGAVMAYSSWTTVQFDRR